MEDLYFSKREANSRNISCLDFRYASINSSVTLERLLRSKSMGYYSCILLSVLKFPQEQSYKKKEKNKIGLISDKN